jgi:four helix bundle protein
MRDFNKLRVTPVAMEIGIMTYRATDRFPAAERFGLTAQMRKAAVSVGSNIAEGCGRSTEPQFLNFLQTASGSVSELEFQTLLSGHVGFGDPSALSALVDLLNKERRMIAKLSSSIRE